MLKTLTYLFLWLFAIQLTYGQERTIKGKVVDQQTKSAIIGATVRLDASSKATQTDELGAFSLEVPSGDANLTISILGYNTVRQVVTVAYSIITISMTPQTTRIADVVVTTLGIKRKSKS